MTDPTPCGRNHEIWFGDADLQSVIAATGRQFAKAVDTLEIIQVDKHAIETTIFGVDNGHSYE